MLFRFGPLACTLLALAGCAQSQPVSYIARTDRLSEFRLHSEYIDDISGPDFALLAGKVDLSETFHHDKPACQGISADGYPNPAESIALRRWIELRMGYFLGTEALQIRGAAVSEKATPIVHLYVGVLNDGLKRSTALISDLADGKTTYCQFAEADKSLTESVLVQAGPLHAKLNQLVPGSLAEDLRSARPDTLPVVHNGMDINNPNLSQ